jgi:hypothetical protein
MRPNPTNFTHLGFAFSFISLAFTSGCNLGGVNPVETEPGFLPESSKVSAAEKARPAPVRMTTRTS